jgi:hypothetical protein
MQYCNKCGKEIPINANVCSYCGSYFDTAASANPAHSIELPSVGMLGDFLHSFMK